MTLHPTIAEVTARIAERSRASRSAYLARIDAARGDGAHRRQLSCGSPWPFAVLSCVSFVDMICLLVP